MNFFKLILAVSFAMILATAAYAQSDYSSDSSDESSECVGDGCGDVKAKSAKAKKLRKMWEDEDAQAGRSEDECTEEDADLPECKDEPEDEDDDDDDDDTYGRYVNDNTDIARASREGFSSGFSLGFRIAGGFNMMFLGENLDGWGIGYEANAGLVTLARLGNSGLYASAELDVGYYRYRYADKITHKQGEAKVGGEDDEKESVDWVEDDEATLNVVLFEIPIILKYAIAGGAITIGLGVDLGLKLTGSSEFKQTINMGSSTEIDDPHDNTLPTAGVEVGGVFEIAYMVNKNFSVDIRVLQRAMNLLNEDVVAETSLLKTKLLGTYGTLGISLFL